MALDRQNATTGALVTVVTITITSTAQTLSSLLGTLPAGKAVGGLLQATLLAYTNTGAVRDPVLYGASDTLGYIAAGNEKILPIRGGNVYLKRFNAVDVTAQVELIWY